MPIPAHKRSSKLDGDAKSATPVSAQQKMKERREQEAAAAVDDPALGGVASESDLFQVIDDLEKRLEAARMDIERLEDERDGAIAAAKEFAEGKKLEMFEIEKDQRQAEADMHRNFGKSAIKVAEAVSRYLKSSDFVKK